MQSYQGIGLYLQKYVCNLIKILAFTSRNIYAILPGSWLLTVDTSMQSYQGLCFYLQKHWCNIIMVLVFTCRNIYAILSVFIFICRNIYAILSGPWLLHCRNIKAVLSGFWFLPAETLMQSYQGYGFYLQKYDTPVVDKIWPFYIWIPGLSWSLSFISMLISLSAWYMTNYFFLYGVSF